MRAHRAESWNLGSTECRIYRETRRALRHRCLRSSGRSLPLDEITVQQMRGDQHAIVPEQPDYSWFTRPEDSGHVGDAEAKCRDRRRTKTAAVRAKIAALRAFMAV